MKKNASGSDGSFGPLLGKRAVWEFDGPDHECDCPGPPPRFYLPPPPRPAFLLDSDCSKTPVSLSETCEVLPVIDAEYHVTPRIPSFAILVVVVVVVVVVVFLLIGTFLVVLKKRKLENFFPRKRSPQSRSDGGSGNGVVYEDLTNIRPRTLVPQCPPELTTLPSIEMIDVEPYAEPVTFAPPFLCSTSPVRDVYDSRELFNPVYEELSNGSGGKAETDSEGATRASASEDEFAEDELSLGREADVRPGRGRWPERSGNEHGRDVDSSDADDRSKFLGNFETCRSRSSTEMRDKGKSASRGLNFCGTGRRGRSPDRKRIWKNKPPPPLSAAPVDASEIREGFLLKRIMQIYPDVTGVGLQYSRRSPGSRRSHEGLSGADALRRPNPDIFSPFGTVQGSGKTPGKSPPPRSGGKLRKELAFPNGGSSPVFS